MTFISFYLFSSLLFAQEVIDLGNLEISGEVRRPMMEYIDSDIKNRKVIVDLLKTEVFEIEKRLTQEKVILIEGRKI
ncbi:MAG: hypothetical protein EP319_10175 [Deltaproteobacteria bacterium]|nr:MAG: hypothetical protein EP319_10175 [Deltaproteobacteria bacterium]